MEEKKLSLRAGSSDQKSSGEAQSIISVINDVDSRDEKVDRENPNVMPSRDGTGGIGKEDVNSLHLQCFKS